MGPPIELRLSLGPSLLQIEKEVAEIEENDGTVAALTQDTDEDGKVGSVAVLENRTYNRPSSHSVLSVEFPG